MIEREQANRIAAELDVELQGRCERRFELFWRSLVIPGAEGALVFDDCVAPFQVRCFRAMEGPLRSVRDGGIPAKRRFWIERTKKSGKDSDIAVCVLWLMAYARRPLLVQISAANQKQAGIIKSRVESLLHYNPWLRRKVRVIQNRVIGTSLGGDLVRTVIEATGTAGGAHGETPDVLILNELVHVDKFSVMETHMNNADGVPRGIVIVSTNAGFKGSKAELWRKEALKNRKRWSTHIFDGVAPWLNEEDVDEAKRRDPVGMEFQRLWRGRWISGRGGAADEDAIDRCFGVGLSQLDGPEPGWSYVAGLDLGISHDHSGVVVLGANREQGRVRVAYLEGWQPSIPNDRRVLEVDSDGVESRCLWLYQTFGIAWFGYDPAAGGSFMAQRLRKRGVPMREMTFSSPTNKTLMALSFVTAVKGTKLECFEDPEGRLRRDFGKFSIVHTKQSGYKLEAVSDEYGHADVGTALLICLPKALELLKTGTAYASDDVLADDGEELTEEERRGMPDDLRDIWEAYEEEDRELHGRSVRRSGMGRGRDRELFDPENTI
jgi:hypothetical protein